MAPKVLVMRAVVLVDQSEVIMVGLSLFASRGNFHTCNLPAVDNLMAVLCPPLLLYNVVSSFPRP